ncbi:hypothetical protein JG559_06295 [Enterococcus faecalis]|uniref:Uncharacterized protein n=1 Tax=Enterococcus faecalis TaxID=1351 RepID=A0A974S7D1_ENTFL|nr:hypothetical protein JG559_06295 [Enterococcus faecalis]
MDVYYQTVVGDNGGRLETLLTEAEQRSDLIVLCGGLGTYRRRFNQASCRTTSP